jgi:hypothetical protein
LSSELDINLFEEHDLNDINTVGSMFKAWLRELPDEILPKETQHRIADKCAGAKTTPQMLKDELSKLSPFNYYLLFAITCHISLLHSCSEMNKMDYRNLCICFQPCMKIEAFCFQFLVLDWRNCWQGCWTEKDYLAKEMEYLRSLETPPIHPPLAHSTNHRDRSPLPPAVKRSRDASRDRTENRSVSSSGSGKPVGGLADNSNANMSTGVQQVGAQERSRPVPPPLNASKYAEYREQPNGSEIDSQTAKQTEQTLGVRGRNGDAPSLSPMKPLSPMDF